jgi:uncharacterized membrane-anchored protein
VIDVTWQSLPVNGIAVAWMLFISLVFLFPTSLPTGVSEMNYTVAVLGGTILLSLAWYYFPKVRASEPRAGKRR